NGYFWLHQSVEKLEAVDKTTFKIVTKRPNAWVLNNVGNNFYSAIAPREWLASPDLRKWAVGAGPFVLQRNDSDGAVLARNPTFWEKGKPYLDTVTVKLLL